METTSNITTQTLTIGERVKFYLNNGGGKITGTIVEIGEFGDYFIREDNDGYIREHRPHGLHRVAA